MLSEKTLEDTAGGLGPHEFMQFIQNRLNVCVSRLDLHSGGNIAPKTETRLTTTLTTFNINTYDYTGIKGTANV